MKLSFRRIRLRPRHRFATAQGGIDEKETIVVELEHDGVVGLGEAVPSALYGQSLESTEGVLRGCENLLGDDPLRIEHIIAELIRAHDGQRAAISAIDSALLDWAGKRLGVPAWRLLGLDRPQTVTTFTLGVAGLDEMRVKLDEALAAGFQALKVKVGVEQDERTLELVRERFDGPVLVDANEGWTGAEAARHIERLARFRPTLIEQPVRRADWKAMAELRKLGVAPIFADESCERPADVVRLAGCVDGINIKLNKCGGVRQALEMIHLARGLGMRVMLGCFVCSSLAIAPALTISPLVDYADLDGSLLLAGDPVVGIHCAQGRLSLGDQPGLGVRFAD